MRLPSLRSKIRFVYNILYIDEDRSIKGGNRGDYHLTDQPIALRMFYGCLRVLLENGTERLFANSMVSTKLGGSLILTSSFLLRVIVLLFLVLYTRKYWL